MLVESCVRSALPALLHRSAWCATSPRHAHCGECGSSRVADKDYLDDIVNGTCAAAGGSFNGAALFAWATVMLTYTTSLGLRRASTPRNKSECQI